MRICVYPGCEEKLKQSKYKRRMFCPAHLKQRKLESQRRSRMMAKEKEKSELTGVKHGKCDDPNYVGAKGVWRMMRKILA